MGNYNVNNRYTYNGNLAYNFQYEEDYGNKFDIKVERTKGLSKREPYKNVKIFFASIFFVGIIGSLLAQYASISTLESRISNTKDEIKTIEDEIYEVDVKIAETLDVKHIRKIAVGKLGMVEPSDSQLMYISVPNEDYTVNY